MSTKPLFLCDIIPYSPPKWISDNISEDFIPKTKINLGNFPTPYHKVTKLPLIPNNLLNKIEVIIKRDDMTSFDLSGNKVRKLEFLLADCKAKMKKDVITIGGIQSNHCRATAIAAKQLGLTPHLILRISKSKSENQTEATKLGLAGNILLERNVGSNIYTVPISTYMKIGSKNLCQNLAESIYKSNKLDAGESDDIINEESPLFPYIIPVGGSNSLGAFGYIEAINEIINSGLHFDHIFCASGSGGTLAGLAIGIKLAGLKTKLHSVCVCDNEETFYSHIKEVVKELNLDEALFSDLYSYCKIYPGQGKGYSKSTEDELKFILELSHMTGISFDQVYNGKALYYFISQGHFANEVRENEKILIIHTGGNLGTYEKVDEIFPLMNQNEVKKLNIIP